MHAVGGILLISGLLALVAAIFDWDLFFSKRDVNPMRTALGRTGTRIVYGILGAGLSATGFLILTGVVKLVSE